VGTVLRDRVARVGAQLVFVPLRARNADHGDVEASAALELVERREERTLREVAGRAEDDECVGRLSHGYSALIAWPPNAFRSAAITFIASESSWRDANRAKRAELITGIGTASRTASFTVHRPSPESSA